MIVNDAKTSILCVSDPLSSDHNAFFRAGSEEIKGGNSLRVLGFTFTNEPTVNSHVNLITSKLRSRTWALRRLRRLGFSKEELVRFYKSAIRPVAEYVSPVFHSMTPDYLSDALERQQTLALRNIFGVEKSAQRLRKEANLETLYSRREKAVIKFALKTAENPRFREWFPKRSARTVRSHRPFLEKTARTDRYRNAPLNYMKRALNDRAEK